MDEEFYKLLTVNRIRDMINGSELGNLNEQELKAILHFIAQQEMELSIMSQHVRVELEKIIADRICQKLLRPTAIIGTNQHGR